MKIGIKILVVLFLTVAFSGCCRRIYPVENTVHDTVTVTRTVRLRDTVIKLPSANSWLQFSLGDLAKMSNNTQKTNQSGRSKVTIRKVDTNIIINCDCDSVAIQAKLKDSLIKIDHQRQEVRTVIQEKKYVPKVVSVLAWIGGIALLGIIGLLVKKFWL